MYTPSLKTDHPEVSGMCGHARRSSRRGLACRTQNHSSLSLGSPPDIDGPRTMKTQCEMRQWQQIATFVPIAVWLITAALQVSGYTSRFAAVVIVFVAAAIFVIPAWPYLSTLVATAAERGPWHVVALMVGGGAASGVALGSLALLAYLFVSTDPGKQGWAQLSDYQIERIAKQIGHLPPTAWGIFYEGESTKETALSFERLFTRLQWPARYYPEQFNGGSGISIWPETNGSAVQLKRAIEHYSDLRMHFHLVEGKSTDDFITIYVGTDR